MAAMSLRPRARARWPISSGEGAGAEVDAFDQQVRGEQQVLARAARPEDGAVVADPQHELALADRRTPLQPLDNLDLVHCGAGSVSEAKTRPLGSASP